MKAFLIVLGAFVVLCSACPKLEPQLPFEWEKFNGLWYSHELMRNNPDEEPILKCLDIYFMRTNDVSVYANSTAVLDTGFEHELEGPGTIMDLERPSHWKATWLGTSFDNHILDTDYTTYSLNYACTELDGGKVVHHGVILGRAGATLSEDLINKLKDKLAAYDVDVSTFYKLSPVDCEMRYA